MGPPLHRPVHHHGDDLGRLDRGRGLRRDGYVHERRVDDRVPGGRADRLRADDRDGSARPGLRRVLRQLGGSVPLARDDLGRPLPQHAEVVDEPGLQHDGLERLRRALHAHGDAGGRDRRDPVRAPVHGGRAIPVQRGRSSSHSAATDDERRRVGSLSTTALMAVFVAGAGATWIAGVFLSDTTDVVDDRFNLGQALGGLILLGFAGTLPEIAITVSAVVQGHLGLATGNLLGGIAMQTLVLVLLDATSRSKTPLSTLSTVLEPIIEAVSVIILVTMALLGPLLPASVAIGPVSPISLLIVITWFLGLLVLNRLRASERWTTVTAQVEAQMVASSPGPVEGARPNRYERSKTSLVVLVFALASGVTLIAGVVLEQTGNALANRWGINGVIFGATILAAVTALPEISTGIRAVRLGQVGIAMGDIFGGNQVQMTLFLVADLLAGKPVLQTVNASSSWLGGIGVVVTALFAGGLVIRPPKKFVAIGPDSWLVVVVYAIGLAGLLRIS